VRIRHALAAAAVVLALTGCSIAEDVVRTGGSLANGAVIGAELQLATEELEQIDGVEVTDSGYELGVDYEYSTHLAARADELSEKDAAAALEIVRATFAGDAFAQQPRSFSMTIEDGSHLSLSGGAVSPGQLADEVGYLYALQAAYGSALSMSIDAITSEQGIDVGYGRYISGAGVPDLSALAAVPDTSSAPGDWEFPGIIATGSLPGAEIDAVLASLAEVAPLLDYATSQDYSGTTVQWDGRSGAMSVTYTAAGIAEDAAFEASTDWPVLLAVADRAVASGVRLQYLGYFSADGTRGGVVNFLPCAQDGDPQPESEELLTALGPLAAGATAGYCYEV
jgi:hypothetical protein